MIYFSLITVYTSVYSSLLLLFQVCALRGQKRYSEVSCQTEDIPDEEELDLTAADEHDTTADSMPEGFDEGSC